MHIGIEVFNALGKEQEALGTVLHKKVISEQMQMNNVFQVTMARLLAMVFLLKKENST